MFGLGFGEMLLILVVALIVVGPKKLPDVARFIARGVGEFRRHSEDFQRTIHREIHAPLQDEALRKTVAQYAQASAGPPPGTDSPVGGPAGAGDDAAPPTTEGREPPVPTTREV